MNVLRFIVLTLLASFPMTYIIMASSDEFRLYAPIPMSNWVLLGAAFVMAFALSQATDSINFLALGGIALMVLPIFFFGTVVIQLAGYTGGEAQVFIASVALMRQIPGLAMLTGGGTAIGLGVGWMVRASLYR